MYNNNSLAAPLLLEYKCCYICKFIAPISSLVIIKSQTEEFLKMQTHEASSSSSIKKARFQILHSCNQLSVIVKLYSP